MAGGARISLRSITLALILVALLILPGADLEIVSIDPWTEMARFGWGLLTPDFGQATTLTQALLLTVAFAFLGLVLGNAIGFLLSLIYGNILVRIVCAFLRAIHELFWALIFLQFFGLSPLTGLLAIAIPYAAIFAKVYAEIAEETPSPSVSVINRNTSWLSRYLFGRLPDLMPKFQIYSLYRLECGLRSSAILGFVGLPTLGFYLETAFSEGHYSDVSALLIVFYVLIATIRFWVRRITIPILALISLMAMPWGVVDIELSNVIRFFTEDIVPSPLRQVDGSLADMHLWANTIFTAEIVPGVIATLQVTMLAVALTGALAMIQYPWISPHFLGPIGRTIGHVVLVVIRSTPEYLLAYLLLQFWGPSMLPAVIALALHNGAIIGHLVGRQTETLRLRIDRPRRSIDRYGYEITPRIYPQLLAFLFYRWEVILRETAVFGMLGVATLGFYIDSAFADLRIDKAMVLILATALLNIGIDQLSTGLRALARRSSDLSVSRPGLQPAPQIAMG